mmetsp:Transcript_4683/g.6313  ORF Transcript_4683/g.6313 Transcript_4683/m.6313 type:complete len:204 (+) Transcript_4683:164-775(+)
MPGLLAGVIGAIFTSVATVEQYKGEHNLYDVFGGRFNENEDGTLETVRSAGTHALVNIGFLLFTLFIALLGGSFVGFLVKHVSNIETDFFEDSVSFEVPKLETPYYFDKRGEIQRGNGYDSALIGENTYTRNLNTQTDEEGCVRNSVSVHRHSLNHAFPSEHDINGNMFRGRSSKNVPNFRNLSTVKSAQSSNEMYTGIKIGC